MIVRGRPDKLEQALLAIEEQSDRRGLKWQQGHRRSRQRYLQRLTATELPASAVWWQTYQSGHDYPKRTAMVIAAALTATARMWGIVNYRALLFVDGLTERESTRLAQTIRRQAIFVRKVRGLRDESSTLIRLADSLAGAIRDADGGDAVTRQLIARLRRQGILHPL